MTDINTHTPTDHGVAGAYRTKIYQIKVRGWLGQDWAEWFDGMTITHDQDVNDSESEPVTIMTGCVLDQAALYGLLNKVYRLGMALLAVNAVDREKTPPTQL
jgi:hypothetical protein